MLCIVVSVMKVYSLSDFHLSINCSKPMNIFGAVWDNYLDEIKINCDKLEDDDVLLIAGDISWAMTLAEAKADLEFIGSLKGKKIIIRGNHDYWWKSISLVRNALPGGVYALQNDCIKIGNVVFTGSRGWTTPEFGNTLPTDEQKIYDREIQRFKLGLTAASKVKTVSDKLVVLCHYPPFNSSFSETPFTELFEEFGADAVVYGHLHGSNVKTARNVSIGGIKYYLTSCDLLKNCPINVEL